MLKNNKKTLVITSVIIVLPILAGVWFWNRLPDVMATHFGFHNEPNGFSSKVFSVFGLPLFLLAMQWLCAIVTSQDPRRQNISNKMFQLILWIIPVISLITSGSILSYNLGLSVNMSFFAELLLGVLLIVIGNYLPKARQNYTIGIRTPWTLANEENWNRTHRMGGFLSVIAGLLILLLTLAGIGSAELRIGLILVVMLIPVLYSFLLHARRGM